jgi:hypothetical protein
VIEFWFPHYWHLWDDHGHTWFGLGVQAREMARCTMRGPTYTEQCTRQRGWCYGCANNIF